MAKPEVLRRVQADLERGHVRVAIQRLVSLIADHPQDLELRARLADVYRRAGDVAEAGRWGFLTEDAEPHEIAAFARKNRSAAGRLRLLKLHGEDPRGLGPLAGPRYADLAARAAAEHRLPGAGIPEDDARPPVRRTAPAPVARAPAPGSSFTDLLTAVVVFGPVVVVVCVVIYKLVAFVFASPYR